MPASVTINGRPDFERVLPELHEKARLAMGKALDLYQEAYRRAAPRRTGRLAEHTSRSIRQAGGTVSGTVHPRELYAPMVEHGTGLYAPFHHRITPKRVSPGGRAPVLRFKGADGTIVFRRSVKGQRPRRFIERAKTEVEAEVARLLEDPALKATVRVIPE